MQFIDLQTQYQTIKSNIDEAIAKVLQHGRYIMGPEVAELEAALAQYVGVKHAIGVANGTDALQIALMALGVKAGDEVITTPFSFFATAETIALLGAKPIFVDIDARNYNLDTRLLEGAITPRTKAIMPVSLYGQCADYDEINRIAATHGIPVIEDGAQSFGATYKGRRSCGLTTIGCTSFFPSKPLGAYGDAGACFTNDDELAERIKQLRVHGQVKRYCHGCIGINSRLDTIQAAILIEKLKVFPKEIEQRQLVAARYNDLFARAGIEPPYIAKENTSVYAQYTVRVEKRDAVIAALKEKGVPTAVHYPIPMYRQPALQDEYKGFSLPITEHLACSVLSLPMHPYLSEVQQETVVNAVKACLLLAVS